jgi:alkylation response protein AidB-like acyl-CoA dehydrogenase
MHFARTPEQEQLRDAVIGFARASLRDDMIDRDRRAEGSLELWRRCGEFGIQGLPFPAEYGGSGEDIVTTVMAMEALGYACGDGGLLFGLNAQMWSVQMPILRHGSQEQRERFLPGMCSGAVIGAHGMSEPDSGSDAFSLRTTARRAGDAYVLTGTKTFVSSAPMADLFLVFATVDPKLGAMGVTGFLIEKDTPGLEVGRSIEKMGLRTSPMSEVILTDCRVPAANRLGREGRGAGIFNDSMEWERACILSPALGTMERLLETCLRHVHERRQFGRPIGEFQSVANKLVAMKVRLESSRMMLYRAAWAKEHQGNAATEASMAKLYVSEALIQTCMDAVQVHGGYGFTTEYEVERDLRDALGATLYSGTSEIQKAILARALGL